MTKGSKTTFKILILVSGAIIAVIIVAYIHSNRAGHRLFTHVLGGEPPASITIQRVYHSGGIFDSSYVFQLSHDKSGHTDMLDRGFTSGGEPGIELAITWIEDVIADTLDRSKGWILFRNRVEGKDLYYIVSKDHTSSYLLIVIY